MEETFGSVKAECKSTKIKAAVKLFENPDTTMSAVRKFEEKAVQSGCCPIIKGAEKYASELHLTLTLQYPNPRATTEDGDEIGGKKLKNTLGEKKWQGKLTKNRWED